MAWIKCSERLPEVTGWYKVKFKDREGEWPTPFTRDFNGRMVWLKLIHMEVLEWFEEDKGK